MAFTKAQLEALKNSQLASNQPITAAIHRAFAQNLIDELYDAQSRGNLLAGVQEIGTTAAGDEVLVIRAGQAYLIPASLFGGSGISFSDLDGIVIVDPQDGDLLSYDAATDTWVNLPNTSISSAGAGLSIDGAGQVQLGNDGAGVIDYSDDSIFENYIQFSYADSEKSLRFELLDAESKLRNSFDNGLNSNEAEFEFQASMSGSLIRINKSVNGLSQGLVFHSSDNLIKLTDQINSKGLEYSGDYEANFTARSLVTKQYVDGAIGGDFVTIATAQSITGAKVFVNALLALTGSNPTLRIATSDNTATLNLRNAANEDAAGLSMSTPANEVALTTAVNNMSIRIQPNGTGGVRFPAVPAAAGAVRMMVLDTNDRLRDGGAPLVQTSGSFTPTLSGTGLTFTYTSQVGQFRRMGNLVFVYIRLSFTASGTPGGGALRVSGLPHTGLANEVQGLPVLKCQNSGYTDAQVSRLSFEINGNVTFGDLVFLNAAFAPLTTYSSCGITIQGSYLTSN